MRHSHSSTPSWQTVLLLVAGVVIVVIIALLLAQTDNYQRRSAVYSSSLPVVNLEATMAAGELAVVYLPGQVNLTPTIQATSAPTTPFAEVILPATSDVGFDTNCNKSADGWFPYIVQAEDSLASLATKFGLTVKTIMQANCLSRNKIIEGQQIYLPLVPPSKTAPAGDRPSPTPWFEGPTQPATPSWPIATPTGLPPQ